MFKIFDLSIKSIAGAFSWKKLDANKDTNTKENLEKLVILSMRDEEFVYTECTFEGA